MSTLADVFDHPRIVTRVQKAGVEKYKAEEVELRQLGPGDIITMRDVDYTVLGQPYMVKLHGNGSEWMKIDNNTPQEDRIGAVWQIDLDP